MTTEHRKLCKCGCGRSVRTEGSEYNTSCRNPCACGCGGRALYAYAPGHRPTNECPRCGKVFSPTSGDSHCHQCRRHLQDGRPGERDMDLINNRAMQKNSPDGKRWCAGCQKYRAIKFFGQSSAGPYSRCKPCYRKQQHASRVKRQYNITADAYEAIKAHQGGTCAICLVATGRSKALAIDHDHSCCPDKSSCGSCVRGLLCTRCNQMLGHGRDEPEFFLRAAEYLQNPPARELHFQQLNSGGADGVPRLRQGDEADGDG